MAAIVQYMRPFGRISWSAPDSRRRYSARCTPVCYSSLFSAAVRTFTQLSVSLPVRSVLHSLDDLPRRGSSQLVSRSTDLAPAGGERHVAPRNVALPLIWECSMP